jgi:hypothetical protein
MLILMAIASIVQSLLVSDSYYLVLQTFRLSLLGDKRIWLLTPLLGRPFLGLVTVLLCMFLLVSLRWLIMKWLELVVFKTKKK